MPPPQSNPSPSHGPASGPVRKSGSPANAEPPRQHRQCAYEVRVKPTWSNQQQANRGMIEWGGPGAICARHTCRSQGFAPATIGWQRCAVSSTVSNASGIAPVAKSNIDSPSGELTQERTNCGPADRVEGNRAKRLVSEGEGALDHFDRLTGDPHAITIDHHSQVASARAELPHLEIVSTETICPVRSQCGLN